jgi:hypothetical protein
MKSSLKCVGLFLLSYFSDSTSGGPVRGHAPHIIPTDNTIKSREPDIGDAPVIINYIFRGMALPDSMSGQKLWQTGRGVKKPGRPVAGPVAQKSGWIK